MVPVGELWLPIVVSALAVFVVSAVVWMVLPYHRTDWKRVSNEDLFLDAVRGQKLAGGMYMFPGCSPAEMKSPEAKAKFEKGPWGTLIVLGEKPSMGRSLSRWLGYLLIVAVAVAFLTGHFVPKGGNVKAVFHQAAAAAWIVFSGAAITGWIWEGKPGSWVLKGVLDGAIYAATMAAMFRWLWPSA